MKTFWYATLASLTTLVLGALISQSFGADRGSSFRSRPSGGQSLQRAASGVGQFRGSAPQSSTARRVSDGVSVSGRLPGTLSPTVKPRVPSFPVANPTRPGRVPTFPVKPPVKSPIGPIKPPVVGPVKPFPPIVKPPSGPIKPPVVGPIKPLPPIVRPPVGPIKPPVVGPIKPPIGPIKPPVVGPIKPPIGPIKPPVVGPVTPLPPICPPYCPPKPCPPICPPWNPGGYCGPWHPLPGWFGCYRPCEPICVTLPTYVGTPVVVTETVLVESVAPAAAITDVDTAVEEKLMQVPVGATLTLMEKTLGDQQGQVILQVDPLSVPGQVTEWKADQVTVTLPMFGLSAPAKAQIWLLKADGEVANVLAVELIPAEPQAEGDAPAAIGTAAVTQN